MKIGILGGTFNPVHTGHLILAEEARDKLKLDKIIFMPVNIPPHKDSSELITTEHRYEMCVLAVKSNAAFEVSNLEIEREGKSYSVETLKELRRQYGKDAQLFFLTGSDSLKELFSWKDVDDIFKLSQFVVAERPGYPIEKLPNEVKVVLITPIEVSSSLVRKRVKEGRSIRYLVPDEVREYIVEHNLYLGK